MVHVISHDKSFVFLHQYFPQCFPRTFFWYFLNDFEMVPVAPIIADITCVFTFHIRCISIVRFDCCCCCIRIKTVAELLNNTIKHFVRNLQPKSELYRTNPPNLFTEYQ
jgi:hypothetical protein